MAAPRDPLEAIDLHNPMWVAPFQLLDIQKDHIAALGKYGIIQKALDVGASRLPANMQRLLIPANAVAHLSISRRLDGAGVPESSGLHAEGPYFLGDQECEFEVYVPVVDYPMTGVLQEHTPFSEDEAALVHRLAEELANAGLAGLSRNLIDFDWLGQPPNSSESIW